MMVLLLLVYSYKANSVSFAISLPVAKGAESIQLKNFSSPYMQPWLVIHFNNVLPLLTRVMPINDSHLSENSYPLNIWKRIETPRN